MTIYPKTWLSKAAGIVTGLAAAAVVAGSAAAVELSDSDTLVGRSAFAAIDQGAYDVARTFASRVQDPLLSELLDWAVLARSDKQVRFEDVAAFIDAHPDWPGLATLRRQAEAVMPESLAAGHVVEWGRKWRPLTVDGITRFAGALAETGANDELRTYLREVWADVYMTAEQEEAFLARFGKLLDQDAHWTRVETLLWADRSSEAQRILELLSPDRRALATARIKLMTQAGGVDAAVRAVPTSLSEDEGLLYDRVRWRRRNQQTDGAVELLDKAPVGTPYATRWWTERNILARRIFEQGDAGRAYRLWADSTIASGAPFADAQFNAGWMALSFLNRSDLALQHFERLYEGVGAPVSKARGAYWTGRAHAALGNGAEAERWFRLAAAYPTTFYGQLGAGKVGLPSVAALPADPPLDPTRVEEIRGSTHARAAAILDAIGQRDRGTQFLRALMETADQRPGGLAAYAQVAIDMGRPFIAVRAAKQAAIENVIIPGASYPIPDLPGDMAGLDRAFVYALIRQESEFDPGVVSSANAMGLMQMLPAVASEVADQLGIRHETSMLTADPAHNVRLGTAYLKRLVDRYDGSLILAAAAYNAGFGRVDEWLQAMGDPRTGNVDVVDWIESIPFAETRNYVQRVLENTQVYRVRLGQAPEVGMLERDLGR